MIRNRKYICFTGLALANGGISNVDLLVVIFLPASFAVMHPSRPFRAEIKSS